MATLGRFEDFQVSQKARELTKEVYSVTKLSEFSKDYALRDQIRRAAISVLSNIAEGVERKGCREFINFLNIAKGSASEVRAQLYVSLDQGYINQETCDKICELTLEIGRMLSALQKQRQIYEEKNFPAKQ